MMVGFDPTALALLQQRWKKRRDDADPVVAEQWRTAYHELALVIAVSPCNGLPSGAVSRRSVAVDPSAEVPGTRDTREGNLF